VKFTPAAVHIDNLLPMGNISHNQVVTGQIRGNWSFEGSFVVEIYDSAQKLISANIATLQGDWMTSDFVPYSVTLNTGDSPADMLYLHFVKENPSGLAENAAEFILPVVVK
jgi:hypothetical protein